MIEIQGHSNFNVEIILFENKYIIAKSSNLKNSKRLSKQIKKQEILFNNNFLKNCKIPKILKIIEKNDQTIYYMEYIYNSQNLIHFLYSENSFKLLWLKDIIFQIINSYISKCKYNKINIDILNNKLIDINKNIKNNKFTQIYAFEIDKYLNYLNLKINQISNIQIPIGICHGDLTLSNMLIDHSFMKIYLIDFLDSFIESPIIDMVKIRQDTCFYWTLQLSNFNYDTNKVKICLNKLDSLLDEEFKKFNWYNLTYDFFQILNYIRILQYSKNNKIVLHCLNVLNKFNILL